MKAFTVCSAAFLFACHSVVFANTGYEIVQKIDLAKPRPTEMKMKIRAQGDFMRVDMGEESSSIINTKTSEITNLMHAQKLMVSIPGGMVKPVTEQMAASVQDGSPSDLKPTGRSETINGYECEEYKGKSNDEDVTVWVTQDIPFAKAMMEKMRTMSEDMNPLGNVDDSMEKLGFPIRMETESSETGKVVVTTLSVKEENIPAAEFQAPSGYRTMELPQGMEKMLQGVGVE